MSNGAKAMPNRKRTVALPLQIFLDPASQPIRLPFLISGRVQSRALRFWENSGGARFFVPVNARFAVANAPTVMIVEDNLIEREGLAAVLRQEGYGIVSAANGKEALERLQAP
jgi:PleD family two-component response regulator